MLNRGKLLVLLLVMVIPILSAAPIFSQQYTTITTESTLTSVLRQSYTELTPITSYATTTTGQEVVIAQTWTNSAAGPKYCFTTWYPFSATGGVSIEGTVSVDQPKSLIVYILSDAQLNAWKAANTCDPNDAQGSMWQSGNDVDVADLNWTPAAGGNYWLLTQTYSALPVVVSVNLYFQAVQAATIPLYSTAFSVYAYTSSQTLTSQSVEELAQQPAITQPTYLGAIAAIALVMLVVFALVLRSRRRGAAQALECPKCGAKLPENSKFCKKCGTALEQRDV